MPRPPLSLQTSSVSLSSRLSQSSSSAALLNPELSLLAFQERVLALAADERTPLAERLRFLAIVSSNLDEFFMVRMPGLRAAAAGQSHTGDDGLTTGDRLDRVVTYLGELAREQSRCVRECIGALASLGTRLLEWTDLSADQRTELRDLFRDELYPLLTPMAMTMAPGHPLPRLRHATLSLAIVFRRWDDGKPHFAELELPTNAGRFVRSPGSRDFIPIEEVIRGNLDLLYPHEEIERAYVFRVTRAAELALDEQNAEDLLEAVDEATQRRPYNPAVRVEVERGMPQRLRELILEDLRGERAPDDQGLPIGVEDLYEVDGLVDLRCLHELELPEPSAHYPPLQGRRAFAENHSVFAGIDAGDVLLHHPFDDFSSSVVRLLREAAADPNVISVKITLYRIGDPSAVVDALLAAARAGKTVAVFVELKARFDEEHNVAWARKLEQAGGRVVYGMVGLKNHIKAALIVRRDGHELKRYVHVGTGNYNERSASQYTDLSLFSCNSALADDVSALFNHLTGASHPPKALGSGALVAPQQLLPAIIARIDREAEHARAGRPAGITIKLNGLSDGEVVQALYAAAEAAVPIDLIVRGICTLRPGVPGLSAGIRVVSILGRFLEHSRIYRFTNGGDPEYFIGSADLRPRNLRRRLELLAPVRDPKGRAALDEILELYLQDVTGWELGADGAYRQVGAPGKGAQELLSERGLR